MDVLRFEYRKGKREIYPAHEMARGFMFQDDEEDEARMVNAMAHLCEKTGLSKNDLMHAIPFVLRMLKSQSEWTK